MMRQLRRNEDQKRHFDHIVWRYQRMGIEWYRCCWCNHRIGLGRWWFDNRSGEHQCWLATIYQFWFYQRSKIKVYSKFSINWSYLLNLISISFLYGSIESASGKRREESESANSAEISILESPLVATLKRTSSYRHHFMITPYKTKHLTYYAA